MDEFRLMFWGNLANGEQVDGWADRWTNSMKPNMSWGGRHKYGGRTLVVAEIMVGNGSTNQRPAFDRKA